MAPTKVVTGKVALGLLPITHVSFESDPLLAWGRIALYATAGYLLWGKVKPASYGAIGAAGLCLLTSLSQPITKVIDDAVNVVAPPSAGAIQ
jgi:hypothetical protein